MAVEQDIEKFSRLMSGKSYNHGDAVLFDEPYFFATENIYGYLKKLDIAGKRVLTVGSSGDQVLYSLFCGAKDITLMDLNPFAKYIYELKVAFIKTFSYEQMHQNFCYHYRGLLNLISPMLYLQVRDQLTGDSKLFWDTAFKNGLNEDCDVSNNINGDQRGCWYLYDKSMFNTIKNILLKGDYKVNFVTTDIRALDKNLPAGKPYNLILLSNISDFVDEWHGGCFWEEDIINKFNQFKDIVYNLAATRLTQDGIIQVGYVWDAEGEHCLDYLRHWFKKDKLNIVSAPPDEGAVMLYPNRANLDEYFAQNGKE